MPSSKLSLEMLDERIHSQGSQIRELSAQIRELASETKSAISGLAGETKQLLAGLAKDFQDNMREQANRRSGVLPGFIAIAVTAVLAACTLSYTVLTLRVAPLEDHIVIMQQQQTQLGSMLDRLSDKINDNYVPRKEIESRRDDVQKQISLIQDNIHAAIFDLKSNYASKTELAGETNRAIQASGFNRERIDGLESRVHTLEGTAVGRLEQTQRWEDFQKQIDDVRENERHDIDELKNHFEQLYPPSTFLKDVNDRVQLTLSKLLELEAQIGRAGK